MRSSAHTSADIENQTVELQLKWFNCTKGFGFLVPECRSFDVFVHITTLQNAGLNAVGEGAILKCRLGDGPKGKQVEEIEEVISEGNISKMIAADNEDGTLTMGGLVKWYKPSKGFGFIIADDGMKDIFVHQSLLKKSDIEELREGQLVEVTIRAVDKGREAVAISLME